MKNTRFVFAVHFLFVCLAASALPVRAGSPFNLFAPEFSVASGLAEGKIIAGIEFDPKEDGFSFRNYGRDHDGSEDLDAGDLIRMFGAENVCIEGSTAADCVLYETAEQWIEERIEGMYGGHCDGFSVAAMRMFLEQPFKGKAAPAQWQKEVETPFDLEFDDKLANYIAYYHSLQMLKEVNTFREKSFSIPPTGIVQMLVESFENQKEFYTLGIGMRENGKYTRGHSILPIAVEDMGDEVYRIHVYDNNFPGEVKFVTVDGKTETWRYRTANNPSDTARDYVGSTKTKTMSLKKMSDRNRKRYECPFCEDEEGGADSEGATVGDEIFFSFGGEGDLLITDPNGKRIGYDSMKNQEVNEIAGAEIVYDDGGLDLNFSPEYVLPYKASATKPYTVMISGKGLKKEVNADLGISGPGFMVGLADVRLDPNEILLVSIFPDGETIVFTASADGETPTIFVTTEDGASKPSYSFEIGGVAIDAGKTLIVEVDVEKGVVHFKDTDGNEDAYDVDIERTSADGKKIRFEQADVKMDGADNFEIDFNKWDERNKPCVEDDDDGNGFADEKCGDVEEEDGEQ